MTRFLQLLLFLPFLSLLAIALPLAAAEEGELPSLRHDLKIELSPAEGSLTGADRITLTGRRALIFDLDPGLEIEEILVDGRAVSFDRAQRPIRVPLPDQKSHEVLVHYGGKLAAEESRAFLNEDGAFLPAFSGWMPETSDRLVTYSLEVTAPSPYRVVATGSLIEEQGEGNGWRALFAGDQAIEPPSLFAGRYEVSEQRHKKILLRTYFPPESSQLAKTYLDNAARYLTDLEDRIGPYPYGSFHIVAGPLPVGLGFPGLTYVSERILRLPFMQTRSLAHEIAHSWWGNAIAIDYEKGNWAEGLTTYMADYALAVAQGADAARDMRLGWLRDYTALPANQDRPVVAFRSKTHDAQQVIGYNKTAFFFLMLERELTPKVFAQGLHDFWKQQQFRVAGWRELQVAFEGAAGRDLSNFFDQWLKQSGAPSLQLEGAQAGGGENGPQIEISLRQAAPPYRLSVPLEVELATGERLSFLAQLNGETATFSFDLPVEPVAASIDPGYEIFRRLSPEEATPILRDITLNEETKVLLAVGRDREAEIAARGLEGQLIRQTRSNPSLEASQPPAGPILLIGLEKEVAAVLSKIGLSAVPKEIAGRGSARAWTLRRSEGSPMLVVAGKDAQSLAALQRPLPHYRRYGYIVFEGSKAIDKGTWSAKDSPLVRRLD